uniref:Uncharacterized protein n=1 Tax=Spongospora subterranea TaxID=70186 RepID=A0A0H5QXI1_9EUKA|eukprot:CRZ06653.1 hypothetical protein [Spongospora subterranea]
MTCPSLQVCTLQPDQYMKKVHEEEFQTPVGEYSQYTRCGMYLDQTQEVDFHLVSEEQLLGQGDRVTVVEEELAASRLVVALVLASDSAFSQLLFRDRRNNYRRDRVSGDLTVR